MNKITRKSLSPFKHSGHIHHHVIIGLIEYNTDETFE